MSNCQLTTHKSLAQENKTTAMPQHVIFFYIHVVNLLGSYSTASIEHIKTKIEENYGTIEMNNWDFGIRKSQYIEQFENLPLFNCLNKRLRTCLCARNIKRRQNFVNCWSKHKTAIPTTLPSNTTHLDFSFNTLRRLKSGSFKNAMQLIFLNLAHNFIDHIERDAFINLRNLLFLDLSLNQLNSFHGKGLFSPLLSLQVLDASYCSADMTESLVRALSDQPHINKLAVAMPTMHNLKFPSFKNLTDLILTVWINRKELPRTTDQKTIVSYFGYSNEEIHLSEKLLSFCRKYSPLHCTAWKLCGKH